MNVERIGPGLAGQLAAATPKPPRAEPGREATRGTLRLARPLEIERTWGDAPHTGIATLDRFESAIAFAIREATRLRRDSESKAMAVSRIEVPEP